MRKNILKIKPNSNKSYHMKQSSLTCLIHKCLVPTILSENGTKFDAVRLGSAHQQQTIFESNIFLILSRQHVCIAF